MSGYIGPLPVPQGIQRKQSFTATAGQTTFNTNGYTDGNFITVYLNGVRLINGTDYTATNGSDVVLASGANAGDVLDFETFQTFSLVDQTFDNVTLKNPTHEDTDGGRESAVTFKGEQSGGEITTLAQIQASHDGTSDDQKGDLIFKTNDGSDNDAPTEAMRIDSSQNLLVGTTDNTPYNNSGSGNDGLALHSGGFISAARTDNTPAIFNRLNSDGDIVQLRKDGGTVVGSIASSGGTDLAIGSGDTGLRFIASSNEIIPWNASGNTTNADAIDIGKSSQRFKDLHLSGGVVFDTVAGNATSNTLDDYEEGTFTPALDNAGFPNFSEQFGYYTKIGDMVMFTLVLTFGNITASNNGFQINGLPFGVKNTGVYFAPVSTFVERGFNATGMSSGGVTALTRNNTTVISLHTHQASTTSNIVTVLYNMIVAGTSSTAARIRLSGVYHTH